MQNNVIAFDRSRKPATRAAEAARAAVQGARNNVVSLADWQSRARARRTASGVFFTTGVLLTYGNAA